MARITRREFIRIASLMGGASLFAGCSLFEKQGAVPEYIKGAPAVDPIETMLGVESRYTICALCSGNCGISCRVAKGVLRKIGGNPFHPVSRENPLPFDTSLSKAAKNGASVCAIGASGIQTLYDPFRILKPLKRIGPRGSKKWKAISWEQAIKEISEGGNLFGDGAVQGLKNLKASGSGFTFLAGRIDWGSLVFLEHFVSQFPNAILARTEEIILKEKARAISELVFGAGFGQLDADYSNASFLMDFGSTPLDSGQPLVSIARQIANSRLKSPCMSWIVVDPRVSTSSSKADRWVPIVPGTDDKMALAIAKALFERHRSSLKRQDEELEKLSQKYSFEDLASCCGIEPGLILKIADMMVEAGPKLGVLCGNGILKQPKGTQTARLILTLNSLVGSTPGSGGLLSANESILKLLRGSILGANTPVPASPQLPDENRALITWEADPLYYEPEKSLKILSDKKATPLFVVIDHVITESAAFADYILPDTTYLERWDLCAIPPSCDNPGFGVRSPVVGGLNHQNGRYFSILQDNLVMEDIVIRLGAALELRDYLPDPKGDLPNAWQFYEKIFSTATNYVCHKYPDITKDSKMLTERVKERGGIFPASGQKESLIKSSETKLRSRNSWSIDIPQSIPENQKDLALVVYTLPFHRSPRSGINSWLLETLPENRLIISPSDASSRNIKQGDNVFIETLDGKISANIKAMVSPGIKPGVVAMAAGFGYTGSGACSNIIDDLKSSEDVTRSAGVNSSKFSGPFPPRIKVSKS
ncbi:MAG: molybdopterin-dependent oxidoreductase [Desulfomonilaceae bacterium]